MSAFIILGMHRSGTSCLASLLIAAGAQVPGPAIRNWDNARGHHEALDLIRLNEAVLATAGGHWLRAPETCLWTDDQAAQRDALLAQPMALLKDPRSCLTWPFWHAGRPAAIPLIIVRHPLAVARSLASWRHMTIDDGLRQWCDYNRPLLALRDTGVAVLDFDAPRTDFLDAVAKVIGDLPGLDPESAWREAYADEFIHHDGADVAATPADSDLLAEACALHTALVGKPLPPVSRGFPWRGLIACEAALLAGNADGAEKLLQELIASASENPGDCSAIAVAFVALAVRGRRAVIARPLLAMIPMPERLQTLLRAKLALAANDAAMAVLDLEQACRYPDADAEALTLLPEALRRSGRHQEACTRLAAVLPKLLYPHAALARLAEWTHLDGDGTAACAWMTQAIETAPLRKRGRLRCRLAVWLRDVGDHDAARQHLQQALIEDPAWTAAQLALDAF
jgi:tetratricopeptide (TPR) repeat protein